MIIYNAYIDFNNISDYVIFIETLKKDSQKLSPCIRIGNSYSLPSFNISQQSFIPIFSNNRAT